MPFGYIDFRPNNPDVSEELGDAVAWYGACLWKNGQTSIDYQVGTVGRSWRLSTYLWGTKASSPAAHADYGRAALKAAIALCAAQPKWVLAEPGPDNDGYSQWRSAGLLCLRGSCIEGDCRFVNGDNGWPIPIYTAPLHSSQREQLTKWFDFDEHLDNLWLRSKELEIPAYRIMADVRSDHLERGREFAAAIEVVTGVPTYLEVKRYYRHRADDEELARPCPGCGTRWRVRNPGAHGIAAYNFRCERCRLVQWAGSSMSDGVRLARIGDWKPGPNIASAKQLRNAFRKGKTVLWG